MAVEMDDDDNDNAPGISLQARANFLLHNFLQNFCLCKLTNIFIIKITFFQEMLDDLNLDEKPAATAVDEQQMEG